MSEFYLVRIEYKPIGGLKEGEAGHRAIVRVGWWNVIMRCQLLVKDLAEEVIDISIEAPAPLGNGDFLISAGPAPEQPR